MTEPKGLSTSITARVWTKPSLSYRSIPVYRAFCLDSRVQLAVDEGLIVGFILIAKCYIIYSFPNLNKSNESVTFGIDWENQRW